MKTVSPKLPSWLARWADGALGLPEQEIEPITLPSGKIVACDPLVFLTRALPFARTVAPGRYRVRLSLSGSFIALACIRFGRSKVARWEVASWPDQEASDGIPGYGVDSGTGCFADADVAAIHAEREKARYDAAHAKLDAEGVDPKDQVAWRDAFEAHFAKTGPDLLSRIEPALSRQRWASLVLDEASGGNLVAFKSGVGDGVYASYWGLDSRGRPAVLITDFGLLDTEEDEEDEDDEELEDEGDLEDAELYALALAALRDAPAPAVPPPSSPLLPRAKQLVARWERTKKIELEEDCDRDAFAEALLEKLVALEGHRHVGSHISEWMMERPEVLDVFASDDELENDLRQR